jgi:hypothetical protein
LNGAVLPPSTAELEHHLTELREAIDSKYVYKYSKLVSFFADLVAEGKLDLADLRGLSEVKLLYTWALRGEFRSVENSTVN